MNDLADRGRRVGRYEIATRLTGGGVTDVFLARTIAEGGVRFIALKQLRAELRKNAAVAQQYVDGARVTASLVHAHVGRVYEVGLDRSSGEPFLAMEFVQGQDVRTLMEVAAAARIQLPVHVAVRLVHDLCLGLHAGHTLTDGAGSRLGVVHGSVTARNLMVTYQGRTKLLDFGVAPLRAQLRKEHPGQLFGTLMYSSPEQVLDHPVDQRTDLFAAGTLLWELLTGQRMYSSEAGVPRALVMERPAAPGTLVSDIPPALDEAVLAALEKNPDDRPASASAFARALAAAVPLAQDDEVAELMRALFDDRRRQTEALLAKWASDEEEEEKTASMVVPAGAPLGDEPWETTQVMTAVEATVPARGSRLPPSVAEAPPPPPVARATAAPPVDLWAPPPPRPSDDLWGPPPEPGLPAELFAPPPPLQGGASAPPPRLPTSELFAPPPPVQGGAPPPRLPTSELFAPPPPVQGRAPPPNASPRPAPAMDELFAPPPPVQGRAPAPNASPRPAPAMDELFAPPPPVQGRAPAPNASPRPAPAMDELFAPPPPVQGRAPAPNASPRPAPAMDELFAPPPPPGRAPAPNASPRPPATGEPAPPPPAQARPSAPEARQAPEPAARPAPPAEAKPAAPPKEDDEEPLRARRSGSERTRWLVAVLLLLVAAGMVAWFIQTKWLAPLPELPKEVGTLAAPAPESLEG
ncbi:MAG: protein kinase [Myxococcota bacterium]